MVFGAIDRQGFGKVRMAFGGGINCRPVLGIGFLRLLLKHAPHHIATDRDLQPQSLFGIKTGGMQTFELRFDCIEVRSIDLGSRMNASAVAPSQQGRAKAAGIGAQEFLPVSPARGMFRV